MIVGVRLAMGGRVHGVVHGRRGAAGEPVLMPEIDRWGVVAAKTTSPHSFTG